MNDGAVKEAVTVLESLRAVLARQQADLCLERATTGQLRLQVQQMEELLRQQQDRMTDHFRADETRREALRSCAQTWRQRLRAEVDGAKGVIAGLQSALADSRAAVSEQR